MTISRVLTVLTVCIALSWMVGVVATSRWSKYEHIDTDWSGTSVRLSEDLPTWVVHSQQGAWWTIRTCVPVARYDSSRFGFRVRIVHEEFPDLSFRVDENAPLCPGCDRRSLLDFPGLQFRTVEGGWPMRSVVGIEEGHFWEDTRSGVARRRGWMPRPGALSSDPPLFAYQPRYLGLMVNALLYAIVAFVFHAGAKHGWDRFRWLRARHAERTSGVNGRKDLAQRRKDAVEEW